MDNGPHHGKLWELLETVLGRRDVEFSLMSLPYVNKALRESPLEQASSQMGTNYEDDTLESCGGLLSAVTSV